MNMNSLQPTSYTTQYFNIKQNKNSGKNTVHLIFKWRDKISEIAFSINYINTSILC